eukprot:gene4042-5060_t
MYNQQPPQPQPQQQSESIDQSQQQNNNSDSLIFKKPISSLYTKSKSKKEDNIDNKIHNKSPSSSTEDLYNNIEQQQQQQQQQSQQQQQYHSPPYRIVSQEYPAIEEEEELEEGEIKTMTLHPNQQQQQYLKPNNHDNSKQSVSPIHSITSPMISGSSSNQSKRSHKRASSHGGPSKSNIQYLYQSNSPPNSTISYLSPQYPTSILKQYPLQASPTTTTTTTTPPSTTITSSTPGSNSNNSNNNKNKTWSPSATRKKNKVQLDPSLFQQQQQQQVDSNSPPISPRNINRDVNHRRAISWEPPLDGKPLETLNQIIKEKKDAILQRERELMIKQKMLYNLSTNQQSPSVQSPPLITSPTSVLSTSSSSSSTSSSPSSMSSNNNMLSPSNISPPTSLSPSPLTQSTTPTTTPHVMKHNRSKSDTNTVLKLNLLKRSNQQSQQQQQSAPSIDHQTQQQQQYIPVSNEMTHHTSIGFVPIKKIQSSTIDGTKSPKLLHSSPRNPAYLEGSNNGTPHHKQQGSGSSSTSLYSPLTTTTTTTTTTSTTSPILSSYPRRKSVDPLTFLSNSHLAGNGVGGRGGGRNSINSQILNSLKNMDLDEFEEEIDKEIQNVILQTKNLQDKVVLLERVRCAAPDPLLMLFGDNCRTVSKKSHKQQQQQQQLQQQQSPQLPQHPTISFQDTPHIGIPTATSRNKPHIHMATRCPDKTKSKNLVSSLPRSSAFSPPPRS